MEVERLWISRVHSIEYMNRDREEGAAQSLTAMSKRNRRKCTTGVGHDFFAEKFDSEFVELREMFCLNVMLN